MPEVTSPKGEKPMPSRLVLSLKLMKTCVVRLFLPEVAKVIVPRLFELLTGSSSIFAAFAFISDPARAPAFDLFSLGSTLYAICTGNAPFRGDSGWAVLRKVCESEPESIRSINADIPDWLEGIIRKLHAKSIGENSVHGSDAADTAAKEIAQFFSGNEIVG